MGLSDELRDPWGAVVGGLSGGMAWALVGGSLAAGPAIAVGVGVAAGVYGAKVLTGLLTDRGGRDEGRPDLVRPPRSSAARWWLDRAEAAVRSLDALATTAGPGATGDAMRSAARDAGRTLAELARLAAQVVAVEAAEARVDVHDLDGQLAHLEGRARAARDPELAGELDRAASAVRDRRAVAQRLDRARDTLLARMEATALGLEGLVARLAEVLALTATTGAVDTAADEVAELATELEGLRAGLAETEALSRRVLAAAPPEGGA